LKRSKDMTGTKHSRMQRNAELAAEKTTLSHQELALEALGCAVNGMNRVAESWYLTAARKAELDGYLTCAGEYREAAAQQAAAAERRAQ
jgi:hypothetical protein